MSDQHSAFSIPPSAFSVLWSLPLVALLFGCAEQTPWRNGSARLATPNRYQLARDCLDIHSDIPLQDHAALVEDLLARREDLRVQLELPLDNEPILVYLFDGRAAFERFMGQCFPGLPPRRAYFLDNDTQPTVYAEWGPQVDEDLRHEMTHGYLHAVLPHLPLWLDEGLAEYYETPRGARGYNAEHVQWLRPRAARAAGGPTCPAWSGSPPRPTCKRPITPRPGPGCTCCCTTARGAATVGAVPGRAAPRWQGRSALAPALSAIARPRRGPAGTPPALAGRRPPRGGG